MTTASLRRVLIAALALSLQTVSYAGGPVHIYDFENLVPYTWTLSSWPNGLVPIYTDLGSLGILTNAQADALVVNAAWQWSSVPTSSFRGVVAGDFSLIGLGDVSSANGASIIGTYNGGGIHVVYDDDGSILSDYFGVPPTSVLGITEMEAVTADSPEILEAWIVLSGPGVRSNDPSGVGFAGVVTHELGHALNLAHTQANGAALLLGVPDAAQPEACGAPWIGGPEPSQGETMYPYITPEPGGTGEYMATVDRLDDRAALSDLYPGPGWPASKGTIYGQILDSTGNPVIGINVIARNVADPFGDCTSYISGQVSKGEFGPDGLFAINGLTPGASYLLYTDQLLNGAFSVPRPLVLPGPEEYFNGPLESGDPSTDDVCAWTPVAATAGAPVIANLRFNHFSGAPTFLTAPDNTVQSVPFDITADGSVVVGAAGLGGPVFRWDVNANTFDIIGGNQAGQCAISDDGQKIAANVVDTDGINKAAIYENDAWTILPPVPGAVACNNGDGPSYTSAYDISGDGSTVVGISYGAQGCNSATIRGFKWTSAGGTVALPKVDAPTRASRANAVNYNGSVIVGWDDANSGQRRAVQWRNGVQSLIRRNNLSVAEALDVSADGQYITGLSNSATNANAWLWSPSTGVALLGPLVGYESSLSGALSDDASVITGQALDFDASIITPTIWTSGLGQTDFNQFLSSQGVITTGLGMRLGMSMSANGQTITGYANGPYGYVGWLLKIPTALVCHGSETTAVAFPEGLNEHLGHGDMLGACPCVDVDEDGYSTCGGDCNDANPVTHFGASDANCNGVDDNCDGTIDNAAIPTSVVLSRLSGVAASLSWAPVSLATGYDVVRGSLGTLRSTQGDFSAATTDCLGNDFAATTLVDFESPAAGQGFWYVLRAVNCLGGTSYDSGSLKQVGYRDVEIAASPVACP